MAGLYFSAGAQVDFPFSVDVEREIMSVNYDFDLCSALEVAGYEKCSFDIDRSSFDFGLALGTGYMVSKYFGLDFKFILGLTQADKRKNSGYNQMTLSLLLYF
jgi:hypothetical protein